jgi:small subunit ribosomal protein S20
MPNSLSAKKRVRQNTKRQAINRWRTTRVKTAIKNFRATVVHGDVDKATADLKALYKLLDQIASTGTLHRNTAARYKSRLTTRFNAMKKAKTAAA